MGKKSPKIGYYTRTLSGHRQSYLDFVKKKFGGERVQGMNLLIKKDPIFFLMIEDHFLLYCFIGLLRACLGRKTAGLLFRPKPALEGTNLKLKLKCLFLKFLKKIKSIHTLSIVPTPLEPKISTIVDDWIYDFQLWDMGEKQKEVVKRIKVGDEALINSEVFKIALEVRQHAHGKKILVALGAQNKGKGTHILADKIKNINGNNICTVIAGRFDQASAQEKEELIQNGALIYDRFMTDEEILALYAVADMVWCFYDPSYDQASGILGRAVQLGALPIVRPKSFSERFCLAEDISHIAIDENEYVNFLLRLEQKDLKSKDDHNTQEKLKLLSEDKLKVIFTSTGGR